MSEPSAPVFFIDRALGGKIVARVLRDAGYQVETHDAHFAQATLDDDWLPVVGRNGWVVLTADQRIAYRAIESAAVRASGAPLFVLVSGHLKGIEIGQVFLAAVDKILVLLHEEPRPFIAKVYRDGRVQVWKTVTDLGGAG